jgi:hypothetical protein
MHTPQKCKRIFELHGGSSSVNEGEQVLLAANPFSRICIMFLVSLFLLMATYYCELG